MMFVKYLIATSILSLMVISCKSSKGEAAAKQEESKLDFTAGPPAIVYKTRQDYTDKVAVILSEDRKKIVSYPHPQDIARRITQVKPTFLNDGYLLDRQGINQWVAFTRYTFAEYAALAKAPAMAELEASIMDKEPLVDICYCGNLKQFSDVEKSMNALIAEKLKPCEKLKASKE